MSRFQVVVTDSDHPTHRYEERVLGAIGAALRIEQCRTEECVRDRCGDADALLVQYAPVGAVAIAGLPRCRVVVRYGVGYDSLDVPALAQAGVWACNVPDYGTEEVSTQALALVLALNRKLTRLHEATSSGRWDLTDARPIHRLWGQTLGLVGFGRNGRAVAGKASAFGLRLLAYDPLLPAEQIATAGAQPASFAEILESSDIVSLHLPLTPATRHLINAEALAQMRPSALLINTSRGGLVDETALWAALATGRLAGAGLDVLEQEPPPIDHPLLHTDNCIVLPHTAWYSEESFADLKTKAAEEVARVLTGQPPRHPLGEQGSRGAGERRSRGERRSG